MKFLFNYGNQFQLLKLSNVTVMIVFISDTNRQFIKQLINDGKSENISFNATEVDNDQLLVGHLSRQIRNVAKGLSFYVFPHFTSFVM